MRYLQIADVLTSEGGLERFIYNFTRLLESKGIETVVAAFEIKDMQSWGDAPIRTACPGDAYEQWESFVHCYDPDLIIWHVSSRTAALVERLSERFTVVSTVHGVLCPSGSRLHRDHDEICYRTAGYGCLANWYMRKCGSNPSPVNAVKSIVTHGKIVKALHTCNQVYAISEAVKQILLIEGVQEAKIRVFDNTLGEFCMPPPLQLPSDATKVNILYVGRLVYAKGVQYLIRAVRLLLDNGIHAECTIAGDGWYRGKLEELTKELDLERHITFAGKVRGQEINHWYAQCDVVTVPSIWPEPAALVVPEARMMGKPVVVFDAGGLAEWMDIMDGIYVAEHANAQSLADAVVSVLRSARANGRAGYFNPTRIDIVEDVLELMKAR